jgi:hypothetical protein
MVLFEDARNGYGEQPSVQHAYVAAVATSLCNTLSGQRGNPRAQDHATNAQCINQTVDSRSSFFERSY